MVFSCCFAKKPTSHAASAYQNSNHPNPDKTQDVEVDTEYEDYDEEYGERRESNKPNDPSFKNERMQERDERELFGDNNENNSKGEQSESNLNIQATTESERDGVGDDEDASTQITELKLLQETKLNAVKTDGSATVPASRRKDKYSTGKSNSIEGQDCTYISDDDDVDTDVLTAIIPEEGSNDSVDSDDDDSSEHTDDSIVECNNVSSKPVINATPRPPLKRLSNDVCPVQYYAQRPVRTGMWFIAHDSYIKKLQHQCSSFVRVREVDGSDETIKENTMILSEPISLWEEFMICHPNATELAGEFVMIQLSEEFISQYPQKIRIASYEWRGEKGISTTATALGRPSSASAIEEYLVPSNYVWFLEYLKHHEVVGWMDFVSNIAVNVPKEESIAYMGNLFADLSIVSEWMVLEKNKKKKKSRAVEPVKNLNMDIMESSFDRAWMYPEMTFSRMDGEGVGLIFDKIRALGLECLPSSDNALTKRIDAFKQFCHWNTIVSQLFHRRGYDIYQRKYKFLMNRTSGYYADLVDDGDASTGVAQLVLDRMLDKEEASIDVKFKEGMLLEIRDLIQKGYDEAGRTAMHHLCDFFTLDDQRKFTYRDYPQLPLIEVTENATYLSVRQHMMRLCTSPSWKVVDTSCNIDTFFEQYAVPLLAAYANLKVTNEEDREIAFTSIALAIISSYYHEGMNVETFWQKAWSSASTLCYMKGSSGYQDFACTSILCFQPDMPEYERFPGRMHVGGALLGGHGAYETIDGSTTTVDWVPFLVTEFANDVKWDENKKSWYIANNVEVERKVTQIISADDGHQGGKEIRFIQEVDREWCDIYFCNRPLGITTRFQCGIVMTPVACNYVSRAWFFTHHDPPRFPKPANNIIFT